ncbi:glycoside hydrolase family 24 protein [Chitinasiproducens palmae]|uniref:Muramidase (Phage lambda lysozyme) n=1 Tax=Chitinasiproducens palmae TaxID=1770053 RepID=A0A1H2PQU2_9BURK|nr:glycoside hydrolase family 104 protein [Chitinasiproducens palmae]SDV49175.1 Muramidase (phage lambda lysozyme) [Chitinasiproducens palmae]
MARITPDAAGGKNRVAFLDMIAHSEIGDALLAKTDDGYDVLVGSKPSQPILFTNYAQHPNILNRTYKSTAAGRYQILYRWWTIYQKSLNLPDFSPLSQDKYALQQLRERGAFRLIDAGDFVQAVNKVSAVWASLPGAGYGQHENRLADLQTAYQRAGGMVMV